MQPSTTLEECAVNRRLQGKKSRAARVAGRPSKSSEAGNREAQEKRREESQADLEPSAPSASETVQNPPFGKTPRSGENERRTVQAQAARKQADEKKAKPGASSLLRREQNDEAEFTLREGDHSRARALRSFELGHKEHPSRTPNQTHGHSVDRSCRRQPRSTAPRNALPRSRTGAGSRSGNRHSSH